MGRRPHRDTRHRTSGNEAQCRALEAELRRVQRRSDTPSEPTVPISLAASRIGISQTQIKAMISAGKGPRVLSPQGQTLQLAESDVDSLAEQMATLRSRMDAPA